MTTRLPDDVRASLDVDAKLAAALERLGQAIRTQMWDAGKRHGLSPTQLQVLVRLASDPAPRRRIGAIAGELDVTHPTVSDAVAALSRRGLVAREGPGRRAALALTDQGSELAAEVAAWNERTLTVLAGYPAADKQAALRFLLDLIADLHRAGAITVARMCVTCRFFRRDAHPGEAARHHCALVDAPLSDGELRVDCAEHEAVV